MINFANANLTAPLDSTTAPASAPCSCRLLLSPVTFGPSPVSLSIEGKNGLPHTFEGKVRSKKEKDEQIGKD